MVERAEARPTVSTRTRSAFYLANTKNFPKNTEVEAILTFTGDSPSGFVREVTPSPDAVTIREHHSFVELPGPGYKTARIRSARRLLRQRACRRFRPARASASTNASSTGTGCAKKDPNAAMSDPVEPIVYYLDRGAPEPIRSALLEGGALVEPGVRSGGLPQRVSLRADARGRRPMDVRYNVIQWVHRATRGWSYGASITDPRTGEIIKGQVTLGSLRGRQDYMIMEGLLSPYVEGKPVSPEMERVVLVRLRQLAAHEVGHTLGLAHNFAASMHDRASVMDYPPPLIQLASGAHRSFERLRGGHRRMGQSCYRLRLSRFPRRRE